MAWGNEATAITINCLSRLWTRGTFPHALVWKRCRDGALPIIFCCWALVLCIIPTLFAYFLACNSYIFLHSSLVYYSNTQHFGCTLHARCPVIMVQNFWCTHWIGPFSHDSEILDPMLSPLESTYHYFVMPVSPPVTQLPGITIVTVYDLYTVQKRVQNGNKGKKWFNSLFYQILMTDGSESWLMLR